MVDGLELFATTYLEGAGRKNVIQDVSARWWFTFSMVARLLELRRAFEKQEQGGKFAPMLTTATRAVLELMPPSWSRS